MIKICESYAADHDILFNGNKSKLVVFGNKRDNCEIYVNGIMVPVCESAIHVGNLVSENVHDTIDFSLRRFNSSFNYFISSFGKCHTKVKNKLFVQYCTSYYGSQIWPIHRKDIAKKICVSWRMALRRVWNLPYNTHCDILPLLSKQIPIEIQLKCRFIRFYKSLLASENNLVRYLAECKSFSNNSTMCRNVNQILYDLNIDNLNLQMYSVNYIKELYCKKWLSSVNENYIIQANCINDLCVMKERVIPSNLNAHECDFLIRFLCTL